MAEKTRARSGWEPIDVAGALAMRQNGFREEEIALVYGQTPPTMGVDQFARTFDEPVADDDGFEEDED